MHGLESARAERTERAYVDVADLARRGVQAQQEVISSVRALLQIGSRVYGKLSGDRSNCGRYLADLVENIPWLHLLAVAGTDGRIKCLTDPAAVGLNVADRPHIQKALHAHDFALSDYLINRIYQVPNLVATYPALADDGSVIGVVLAVINLKWINELAATAAQRSGASVALIDSRGTLVAGSADQRRFIGSRFAESALAKAMLSGDKGTIAAPGFDGVRRIFAYVQVPETEARLAVGLDENAVHSAIDRRINVARMQLVAFGLFVLLLAWFGGEQLIVRPIRSLVRTAIRLGRGDLQVRATQEPLVAEFAPLAAALDDMATKLAERKSSRSRTSISKSWRASMA